MLTGQPFTSYLEALAALSDGSSCAIPYLLLPGDFQQAHALTELVNTQLIESAADDKDSYCVSGMDNTKDRVTLWIDKTTFLIHKIKEDRAGIKSDWTTVTTYWPEIDCEITDRMLEFERNEENTPLDPSRNSWSRFITIGFAIVLASGVSLGIFMLARRKRKHKPS